MQWIIIGLILIIIALTIACMHFRSKYKLYKSFKGVITDLILLQRYYASSPTRQQQKEVLSSFTKSMERRFKIGEQKQYGNIKISKVPDKIQTRDKQDTKQGRHEHTKKQ